MKLFLSFLFFICLNSLLFSQTIPCENPILGASCYSGDHPENGSGSLGMSYTNTACGLNYVQASLQTTTRYTGSPGSGFPATLTITGLPCGGVGLNIVKAYVWWGCSNSSVDASFTFNGVPMMGTLIGTGPHKCWGLGGTENYRGDVTAAITGNGGYTFSSPIGNGVDGATLMIIYVDPTVTYQGTIQINDGDITSNSGGPSSQTMTGLNVCANSTYGNAFTAVGDMQNNVAPPTHTVTMNGTPTTFPNNFWNFDVANRNYTAGQTTSAFTMTSDGGNDCYDWVLMGIYYQTTTCVACVAPGCGVLPIELISFAGENHGKGNELSWITASEINNDYFVVEASHDGKEPFYEVGRVPGNGNSNENISYQFIDERPMSSLTYYRLKQVDFNNEFTYSSIISLNAKTNDEIFIYPNPSSDELFFDISESKDGIYTILYSNTLGSIAKEEILITKKVKKYPLKAFSELNAGIYFIQILDEEGKVKKHQKVIKK